MIEGKASYCPIPIISKTNQIIPVETRISKGVWNDRPVIFGVSKDISELKISEEKFSSAFLYSANIMAISLFETGEYIEVNQAFLDLFGLKREQVIGHNAIELGIFPVELRERLIQEFSKNNKLMNYEVTLEVKDKKVTGLFSANLIQIQNKKCWLTSMQNITDRKITEEALKQSKQELETIFSASPDGIAMTDINGNLVIASDKLAKMYGFDVDEMQTLIGRSIFDFIHPSDHHILKQNFNKLITNQIDEKVTQYLAVKKDKSTFYIEVNYSLINNHQGDPCNILFIGRDITQRKQIDEILQRWARIFEYSGWGIVIVSPDGKTMEMMNPAFAKMHGYNETELVNQNLSVVFSSDSFTKICTFTGNDQTQIHQSWEAVNIKKSNEYFPVLIDTTRVNDQLGIIQYYVINVMDISERKLSEVALRESETRLRLAIEGSKAGTWDWNIQTGEVIYGQYWAEMIGYSIEEIEPNIDSWEKLICPEDLINVKTALKNHFDGHTPFYEAEHRMKTKTGEWKWILDKGMVVSRDENGSPLRAIGTHVDIDASKKAQIKLLEYNKQLKELDATKDKLFSIIAHDLKNPISGVLAISGLLVENFKKYEIQKNEKFLDQIHNASKNALNLLENLLYWARSQTGKMAFNPEKYLLSPLINESIEVTKSAARIKFIHIDTLIDEKLVVNVDQNLMQTVLRNLVTNAIKFTNPGGNITIEAKNIDNKVQISVTDNGVGMTKSQLEKLFSKEITEITAGTANEKGSGLGLLICKEFVEMHNGTISVESEPGKGSRFNILLP
jgi:PAS domain S-box-containing protein